MVFWLRMLLGDGHRTQIEPRRVKENKIKLKKKLKFLRDVFPAVFPLKPQASSRKPQMLFKHSAIVGCAQTASLISHHFTFPIIEACTTLISSPPSTLRQLNPKICPVSPLTTALIIPLASSVSKALA